MNSTQTALVGGTFVLVCALTGSDVEWRKNGEAISSYNGQVWLFEVTASDQGEYLCSLDTQLVNYLLLVHGTTSCSKILLP